MLCVLIVDGMYVVVNGMLSLMSVMSPPPALCNLSVRTAVKLSILGVLALGVSLVFLNCGDVCMCVVNKPFELLEFVYESVYVGCVVWSHPHLIVLFAPQQTVLCMMPTLRQNPHIIIHFYMTEGICTPQLLL